MKTISLFSRDIKSLVLQQVGSSEELKFVLQTTNAKDSWVLEYCNVCKIPETNNYRFVDPSGGPMIAIGTKFDNLVVSSIYLDSELHSIVFEMKEG